VTRPFTPVQGVFYKKPTKTGFTNFYRPFSSNSIVLTRILRQDARYRDAQPPRNQCGQDQKHHSVEKGAKKSPPVSECWPVAGLGAG